MRYDKLISTALLLALLWGCPTTQSKTPSLVIDSSKNVYTNTQSGFSFPPSLGLFQRGIDIKTYTQDGAGISVPYTLKMPQEFVMATIYVYPARQDSAPGQPSAGLVNDEYEKAKKSVFEQYTAKVKSERDYTLNRSVPSPNGKKCVFEGGLIGGGTAFTDLYLFTHKGWIVQYRFTYSSRNWGEADTQIKKFIDSFEWP
jgi:hypothetical protein